MDTLTSVAATPPAKFEIIGPTNEMTAAAMELRTAVDRHSEAVIGIEAAAAKLREVEGKLACLRAERARCRNPVEIARLVEAEGTANTELGTVSCALVALSEEQACRANEAILVRDRVMANVRTELKPHQDRTMRELREAAVTVGKVLARMQTLAAAVGVEPDVQASITWRGNELILREQLARETLGEWAAIQGTIRAATRIT